MDLIDLLYEVRYLRTTKLGGGGGGGGFGKGFKAHWKCFWSKHIKDAIKLPKEFQQRYDGMMRFLV